MSRLTQPEPATAHRDVGLAAWVSANTDRDLGGVELPRPIVLWSGAGDAPVAAGRHDLAELGALACQPAPVALGLDVWCRSTGVVSAGSWPALTAADLLDREAELERSIKSFLHTMFALGMRCPDVLAWITAATRVVRPLVPLPDVARSSHDRDVPGLVEADISRGPAQTIELVVHETAHLHLRAAEAEGPLVDPGHTGTYRSPLRPEPRPLIGLVLAYHALAYICAALEEAAHVGLIDQAVRKRAADDLACRRDDARSVIDGARDHLTDAGQAFIARTHEVADHAIA
jgi:HEXXH motif-containing protein